MAEAPLSMAQRNKILERTIAEIEAAIDAAVAASKNKEDLKKEFRIYLAYNSRTTDAQVQQTIIARYRAAGWDDVHFELDSFRNETEYQVVLEQD